MQSNLTHLSPTDIYCIEVPKEAHSIVIEEGRIYFIANFASLPAVSQCRPLPSGDWQILGLMTSPTGITFDPAPYLEKRHFEIDGEKKCMFMDYNFTHDIDSGCFIESPLDSLLSLLSLHGKHWKNPMGEKPTIEELFDKGFNLPFNESHYENEVKQWQSLEDNLIKNKLLLLKKVN